MNIKINFLLHFIFLVYEIKASSYDNENKENKIKKYQINKNLLLISTLTTENISSSLHLSLIDNNKTLDYKIIQSNSVIKTFHFIKKTQTSLIIKLNISDYIDGDFLEFYQLYIKKEKFIIYEFLYRETLSKYKYTNKDNFFSNVNIIQEKKKIINRNRNLNLLSCFPDFIISLNNKIELKANNEMKIEDTGGLQIISSNNELKNDDTISANSVFSILGQQIGNFTFKYIIISNIVGSITKDCTNNISIVDIDCPSKDIIFNGDNIEITFNDQPSYIEKVFFTNIPQDIQISPKDSKLANKQSINNIYVLSSSVEGVFTIDYQLNSSNGYITKSCSLQAKKVIVECPEEKYELLKGCYLLLNFNDKVQNIDQVIFDSPSNGLTFDPEIEENNSPKEFPIDTIFKISFDETISNYQQDYTLKLANTLVLLKCSLDITIQDFSCPVTEIPYIKNYKTNIDLSSLPYPNEITFKNIPNGFTITEIADSPGIYDLQISPDVVENEYIVDYSVISKDSCSCNDCTIIFKAIELECPIKEYKLSKNESLSIDFKDFNYQLDLVSFSSDNYLTVNDSTPVPGEFYELNSKFNIVGNGVTDNTIIDYTIKTKKDFLSKDCTLSFKIYDCHSPCYTCYENTTEDNPQCKSCSSDYILDQTFCYCTNGYRNRTDDSCNIDCSDRMVKDETKKECVNCQWNNTILREEEKYCVENVTSNTNGYFLNENTDDKDYNYYRKCPNNCTSCVQKLIDSKIECTVCNEGYILSQNKKCIKHCGPNKYFYNGQCQDTCEIGLFIDEDVKECINCKTYYSEERYSYKGKCQEEKPSGNVFEVNNNFNYYDDCYERCESCVSKGEEFNHKCTVCKVGYYSTLANENENENNCVEQCEMGYYQNATSSKCEKCKNYLHPSGICLDEIPEGYYASEEPKNYLRKCGEMCKNCTGPPSIKGQNCEQCSDSYKSISANKSLSCVLTCPDYLSEVNSACINCKDENKVKYLKDNTCIEIPPNVYKVNETYNIIEDCYETCATCENGGNKTNHNCTTCIDSYIFSSTIVGNCVKFCEVNEVAENGTCVNCAKKNLVKHYNRTICEPKPESTYFINDEYGIVKDCYPTCKTCNYGSTSYKNQNCKSCKDSYYDIKGDGNCIGKCPEKQFYYNGSCVDDCPVFTHKINFTTIWTCEKCDNFYFEGECYATQPESTYRVNNTKELKRCHSTCLECNEGETIDTNNCIKCKDGYFLNGTDCVLNCEDVYFKDYSSFKCVNCKELNKYKYLDKNECIDQPIGTYVENNDFNIIKKCYSTCQNCSSQGDPTDHQCDECINGYFMDYNSSNCVVGCSYKYFQNEENKKCENCVDKQKYKYSEINECIDKPKSIAVIDNTTGLIRNCPSKCSECGYDNNKGFYCPSCTSDLFFLDGQCVPSCGSNLIEDKYGRKCIDCKPTGFYKVPDIDVCTDKPNNTYFINETFNVVEYCYETCATCATGGNETEHNCTTCKIGYVNNSYISNQCEIDCKVAHKMFYVNEDKSYSCTNGMYCNEDKPYKVEKENQCVESCFPSSSCIKCGEVKMFLDEEKGECVEKCPEGTFYDHRNYKCSLNGNNIPCQINTLKIKEPLSLDNIKSQTANYIQTYLSYTTKNVDIIKGDNYIYEIFYENQCQYNISYNYNYSYIDMSECEMILKEKYPSNKIVFVKIDMRYETNNNTPNQIEYLALDENNNKIDISICNIKQSLNVTYPLLGKNLENSKKGKKYDEKGIDIFTLEDSFFNDVCYSYYTKEKKNVVLKDRRDYIYIPSYLCPLDCIYSGTDYHYYRVNCSCPFLNDITLEYINEEAPTFPSKYKGARNYNWLFVKCIPKDLNSLLHNEGTITIVSIIGVQLLFTIIYFIRGLNQFCSAVFRNVNFERSGNPPKKINICFQNNLTDSSKTLTRIIHFDTSLAEYEYSSGTVDKIISPRSEKSKTEEHVIEPYKLEKRKVLDDDILDVLEYQEGIFLDVRTLSELFCHLIKEKMLIISSFYTISEYESYPIQIMYLLLSLSILLFINAFLFLEKYISRRYKTLGDLGIVFLLEYEIEKSATCGAVGSFLLYIISLFFSTRKKIKYLKHTQKIKENFLIEAEKLITSYKKKNIISIVVCFVLMLIILFYMTVFIEVYPTIFIILLESYFISIPFCMIFQTIICLSIAALRTIGKSWYSPCVYKLSKLLI